ncbi:MAG: pantetheine-phosphate adenylyltransferase [Anaerolineaceae bacterium]|jgi:pantetheine-phosphate adenylyltransferase|nr:pantetheine-phosphate adenylyltransferase [Anaerolineaceae bacterium]
MVKAVFPGTFDPIHFGHIDIATRASCIFDELVVAVYDRPLKNLLFMPDDRIQMVKKAFSGNSKILVQGYSGLTVDFCKKIDAQVIVRGLRVFSDFEHEFRMALANHRLAADIEVIALITSEEHSFLSSTTVREIAALGGDISSMVPAFIQEALKKKFSEFGESRNDLPITSLRD